MDIEKLIETLRQHGVSCVRAYGRYCSICDEAATALSTLQAENEKLRAELEYEKEHANAYYEECGQWEAENTQLRAELEQVISERDAAIECLKNKCPFCRKYLTCQGRTINNDCWEFFGLKED